LWRNRDFSLLWSSQTLSDIGSSTTLVAVPLLVLSLGGSATAAGATGTIHPAGTRHRADASLSNELGDIESRNQPSSPVSLCTDDGGKSQ
jgi:hypothetical protein